jgi:hypothetical protein
MAFDKNKPAGSTPLNQSDNQIRDNNAALEAAIAQDHDFATGGNQTGKHKQVTFPAALEIKPIIETDKGALYLKIVSEKAELFYEDEDGHEIQITSGGILNFLIGLTASVAELNINHGLTATTEEINTACDGATARNSHAHSNINISAGTGLSGGGDLSTNRTISHAAHTGDVTGSASLSIASGAVTESKLASGAVSQAKLKTDTGQVTTAGSAHLILPGGEYGFYPRFWKTVAGSLTASFAESYPATTSPVTVLYLNNGGANTVAANQRYITSSGEVFWTFLLRDKSTGQVVSTYLAPDHPCFGNGNDPLLVQHPFPDYNPEKHEIIVINPDNDTIAAMKEACLSRRMGEPQKALINLIVSDNPVYEIEENIDREYDTKPVTVGIVNDELAKPLWYTDKATIIKMRIPQPEYVKVRSIKKWMPKVFA